eukprot:COSAG06_NODE_250_length_19080_cov_6.483029_22_plen_89_part_00
MHAHANQGPKDRCGTKYFGSAVPCAHTRRIQLVRQFRFVHQNDRFRFLRVLVGANNKMFNCMTILPRQARDKRTSSCPIHPGREWPSA